VSEITSKIKSSKKALWEEVEHSMAALPQTSRNLGMRSKSISKSNTSGSELDTRRIEHDDEGDEEKEGNNQLVTLSQTRTRGGVGGEELWLLDGIDAKTRR
jgi:hypothetical protein